MPRTKQTAKKSTGGKCPRQQLRTMTAKKKPLAKKANKRIKKWLMPSSNSQMTREQFDSYNFLTFDPPQTKTYMLHDGFKVNRLRVAVKHTDGHLLGYIPVPTRYGQAWIQLCYLVVYYRNSHMSFRFLSESEDLSKDEREMARLSMKSAGAMLRYYILARRLIILELLGQRHNPEWTDSPLPLFNEYIIKERFDWHWDLPTDPKELAYFDEDPFGDEMKDLMGT
jgi:hypothetical protein